MSCTIFLKSYAGYNLRSLRPFIIVLIAFFMFCGQSLAADTAMEEALENVPQLLSPANQAEVALDELKLEWTSIYKAISYRVKVADNAGFASPAIDQITTKTRLIPQTLNPDTTYFWKVTAQYHNSGGKTSGIGSFTTLYPTDCFAPILNPIGNQSVTEGQTLTFPVTVADQQASDRLTFSASSLPPGAVFNADSQSGMFTWETTQADAGNYMVAFEVCNDCSAEPLCHSQEIAITVGDVCHPPDLSPIGDRTAPIFYSQNYTITATDPDPESILTYSAVTLHSDNPGMEYLAEDCFDPETQTFFWLPELYDEGEYRMKFQVCDDCPTGPLCDEEEVNLTITLPLPEYYQGVWNVSESDPQWISSIVVSPAEEASDQALIFEVTSDCTAPDCPEPILIDNVDTLPITLNYHFDYADITMDIYPKDSLYLRVHLEIDYTEEDGREDVSDVFFPDKYP